MLAYTGVVLWLIVAVWRLTRRRGRRVTPGTAMLSSMELHFDDTRRAAVEVIVEERTGERDSEHEDGAAAAGDPEAGVPRR